MSSFFQKLAGGLKFGEGEEENQEQEIVAVAHKNQSSQKASKNKPPQKIKIIDEDKNEEDKNEEADEKEISQLSAETQEGQLALDVYQTDSEIIIKSTIAGVKPEDLDIEITNELVTIRGKREQEEEIKTDDYYYQECYWGSFSRSVALPQEIDAEKAEAALKNGVLTIHLPKFERAKSKKLRVKGEE